MAEMTKEPHMKVLIAKWAGECAVCGEKTMPGQEISRISTGWGHVACVEYTVNKLTVESGESFRAQQNTYGMRWRRTPT